MSEYIVEVRGQMPGAVYESQREEVVRCRDCVYFAADRVGELCGLFDFEMIKGNMADGYCAWGKRRSE